MWLKINQFFFMDHPLHQDISLWVKMLMLCAHTFLIIPAWGWQSHMESWECDGHKPNICYTSRVTDTSDNCHRLLCPTLCLLNTIINNLPLLQCFQSNYNFQFIRIPPASVVSLYHCFVFKAGNFKVTVFLLFLLSFMNQKLEVSSSRGE